MQVLQDKLVKNGKKKFKGKKEKKIQFFIAPNAFKLLFSLALYQHLIDTFLHCYTKCVYLSIKVHFLLFVILFVQHQHAQGSQALLL